MNKVFESKEFSEKELALFEALGVEENLVSVFENKPTNLYSMIAEQCYIENKQGPAADSLRRCLKAINTCKPYRRTSEFESLIQLPCESDSNLPNMKHKPTENKKYPKDVTLSQIQADLGFWGRSGFWRH